MVSPQPSYARIALFGGFAAFSEERRVAFARRSAERLLAYLALHGAAERSRVAEALWPEASHEHALMNLRQAIRAVVAAGCEGWVKAEGSTLRLTEGVSVDLQEESPSRSLLEGWADGWIETFRAREREVEAGTPERAADALFDLLTWHRERSPQSALRVAIESESLLETAAPARLVAGVAPLLARFDRLPDEAADVCNHVARAHYLLGQMPPSFELYGRIAREFAPSDASAHARLAQVVLLRESGAVREAARRAEAFAAAPPPGSFFRWSSRYHRGYARYHAYGRSEDLDAARRAVESDPGDATPLIRLFPALNVAEALIDDGRLGAGRALLDEARALARQAGDPLALLTAQMLDLNLLDRQGARAEALTGMDALGERAARTRLLPFAALVLERAASLAMGLGRTREAHERLARASRMRSELGVRRTPVERARLASLNV